MTGEKNRSTTTEKLWDLDDKQLKTPKHDELVLLLLDKEYVKDKKICGSFKGRVIDRISVEHPIMGHNGFMVGFIDVLIDATEPILSDHAEIQCPHCKEYPTTGSVKDCNTIMERKQPINCNKCGKTFTISTELIKPIYINYYTRWYVECKPQILSFGETVRQIKLYQTYIFRGSRDRTPENTFFILFTPDTRFKDAFESQGIRVISP